MRSCLGLLLNGRRPLVLFFCPRRSISKCSSHVFSSSLDRADRVAAADSLISWNTRVPVKLRMMDSSSPPGNYPPVLVQTMFRNTVRLHPDRVAMAVKKEGIWRTWTYSQYLEDAGRAAKGFLALGLQKSHGVGIMAENSPEWFLSSLGAIFGGGLCCGIYITNSPRVVSFIAANAPLDILVLENVELLQRMLDGRRIEEAFPGLKKIVLLSPPSSADMPNYAISWQQLLEIGESQPDSVLEEAELQQVTNGACMLVYTSGTTGPPKGAMLSHDNITWSARISCENSGWEKEVIMSVLPLSHIAAVMIDCFMSISKASSVYFADKDALKGTLVDNLREIRPTRFLGVPRLWEKIQERMQEAAKRSSPVKKAIANWAKAASLEHHRAVREGKSHVESLSYKIAKRLVFNRIRQMLGLDNAVSTYSGAAPLSPDTYRYFESLDIVLEQAFGCTECSGPQCTNVTEPGGNRPGTVGRAYRGINNKISNPDPEGYGELMTYSRNVFMGYHGEEARTKDVFDENFWFRSGDLGRFDEDDFLTLTGRLKELIITAGGENVAPIPIEDAIKKELQGLISFAVVVGEKRKHLSCLLTLSVEIDEKTLQPTKLLADSARSWAKSALALEEEALDSLRTVSDFCSGPLATKLRDAVRASLEMVNDGAVSRAQRVNKFTILPAELSIAGGELGPTLKLKRFYVYDKYSKEIDDMYESDCH